MSEYTKNNVNILGRLGADPEMRYTPSGTAVVRLSVATNRRKQDGTDTTTWHQVIVWDKLAVAVNEHLVKGSRVDVEGHINNRSYTNSAGVKSFSSEIVCHQIGFLSYQQRMDEAPGEDEEMPFDVDAPDTGDF